MNRILRTLAATAALAASSFAAQAADPVLTPNALGTAFNTVIFDLAPGASITFDFSVTRNHPFFDLSIFDLGAPGDMFAVYIDGNLIGDTTTVANHNYASPAAFTAATINACRSVTALSTTLSSNCSDAIIGSSNYSFGDSNNPGTTFNHFDGAVAGVNTITIKSIQSDTVNGVPQHTLAAFKLICNDRSCAQSMPVPEPTTAGLLFAGLAIVGTLARRRRTAI
jgi:hypothetical protein